MKIFKSFTFDSAHFLPHVPDGHKCKNMHGHTYLLKIVVEGPLESHLNWVMDFTDLKEVIDPIVKELDHKILNDIAGLENPTCEGLAVWIWNKVKPNLPQLAIIELNETPTSGVIYTGE